MTVPTEGDEFAKLTYHLRMAQEAAAMLAHLAKANDQHNRALAWIRTSENFKNLIRSVTMLAMRRMQ